MSKPMRLVVEPCTRGMSPSVFSRAAFSKPPTGAVGVMLTTLGPVSMVPSGSRRMRMGVSVGEMLAVGAPKS